MTTEKASPRSGVLGDLANEIDGYDTRIRAAKTRIQEIEQRFAVLSSDTMDDLDAAMDVESKRAAFVVLVQQAEQEINQASSLRQVAYSRLLEQRPVLELWQRRKVDSEWRIGLFQPQEEALQHASAELRRIQEALYPLSHGAAFKVGEALNALQLPLGDLHVARNDLALCERELERLGNE